MNPKTMTDIRLFFFWQSDLKEIRSLIRKTLNQVKQDLQREDINVILVEDSRTENGAEQIDAGLLGDIGTADLFIADISPVTHYNTESGDLKLVPNSNAMFETGFAIARLGNNRCRLLACLDDGMNITNMPFDINHRKLLVFKRNNLEPLKSIKRWIKDKTIEIEESRKQQKPESHAVILFGNYQSSIDVNPSFRRKIYVASEHDTSTNQNPLNVSAARHMVSAFDVMEQAFNTSLSVVSPTPEYLKPIRKKQDVSLVPITFIIENDGTQPIDNCRLHIWAEEESIKFDESDIDGTLRMPIPKKDGDLFISDDGQHIFESIHTINPSEAIHIGDVYVSLPYEPADVVLKWEFTSRTINSSGELTLVSMPTYEDQFVPNESKIGEIEYSHIYT